MGHSKIILIIATATHATESSSDDSMDVDHPRLNSDQINQVIGNQAEADQYKHFSQLGGDGTDFWDQHCYSKMGQFGNYYELLRTNNGDHNYSHSTVVCAPTEYCVYDSIAYAAWKNEQEHQNYLGHDEQAGFWKCLSQDEKDKYADRAYDLGKTKDNLNSIATQNYFLYIKELNTPENLWKNIPLISTKIMLHYLKPKGWIVPWNSTISEHQIDHKKSF